MEQKLQAILKKHRDFDGLAVFASEEVAVAAIMALIEQEYADTFDMLLAKAEILNDKYVQGALMEAQDEMRQRLTTKEGE